MARRRELTLEIERRIEPEDIPVRGNAMASGDDELDREVEDEILERLDRGDVVAWCYAHLDAAFYFDDEELTRGEDSVGACSYGSERELWETDYGPQMEENAVSEALTQLLYYLHGPSGRRRAGHGATWLRAALKALSRWLQANPEWAVFADQWLEEHPQ